MPAYLFLCSNQTEKECLERNLFGGKRGYKSTISKIKPGGTLFLYNYESGYLHGEFNSVDIGGENIVPEAWGGQFPWQVRMKRSKAYQPLHRDSFEIVLPFENKLYPKPLISEEKLVALQQLFLEPDRISGEEQEYRELNPSHMLTLDGHRVRSQAEKQIDNWFCEHRVFHKYEIKIPGGFCDFVVPTDTGDVYIEFWGLEDQKYTDRKEQKLRWYKEKNIQLLELTEKDLKHLDSILKKKFLSDK